MTMTSRLALPLIAGEQAQKHITHNEALLLLDAAVHLRFTALGQTLPPDTPDQGATYEVGLDAEAEAEAKREAADEARKRASEAQERIADLDERRTELEGRLDRLDSLSSVLVEIESARETVSTLRERRESLAELNDERRERLAEKREQLETLEDEYDPERIERLIDRFFVMSQLGEVRQVNRGTVALTLLEQIPRPRLGLLGR